MNKKPKTKFPRAFFKVRMGTEIIPPKKGVGAKDLNPYNRKAKHKKTTAFEHSDPVVFWYIRFIPILMIDTGIFAPVYFPRQGKQILGLYK